MGIVMQNARRLAIAAGMIAVASLITLKPAQAIDAGTAVGIGGLSSVKWRALTPSLVFAFEADRAGTT
jgi:hypothetical protein